MASAVTQRKSVTWESRTTATSVTQMRSPPLRAVVNVGKLFVVLPLEVLDLGNGGKRPSL